MSRRTNQAIAVDIQTGLADTPLVQTRFDRDEGWINVVFALVFAICGITSGFATFSGIRLLLVETGDLGIIANGTSVILTIAVTSILITGWAVMYGYGPEARTPSLKIAMVKLSITLFIITGSVSSLSNMLALTGPSAKVHDWRVSLATSTDVVNGYGNRALAVGKLRPGWEAARKTACALAGDEVENGTVSASGAGVGPVAVALTQICEQTTAFVEAINEAERNTTLQVADARAALKEMRSAIRDRSSPVIEREDRFLDASEKLNTAILLIQAHDLSGVLDSGAAQVEASVTELRADTAFSQKQLETVSGIKQSLSGLVQNTQIVTARLTQDDLPDYVPVDSPDFIAAITRHSTRFIPVLAASVAIDAFQLWALAFVLVAKAGRRSKRLQGQFDRLIETDRLTLLEVLQPQDQPKRRWFPWFRRKAGIS